MSDYSRQEDFSVKDALTTGDPDKVIKGSEVDSEFDAIVTAVATKIDALSGHTTNDIVYLNSVGKIVDAGILYTDVTTNIDTDVSGNSWVVDEDDMSSDLATKVPTQQSVKAYVDSSIIEGSSATLDPYSTSGSATQAHGLGATPTMIELYLECKTTQYGYAVGDRLRVDADGPAAIRGIVAGGNSTNVFIATSDVLGPYIPPKTGGTAAQITAANWKLVAVPYLFGNL